MAIVDPTAGVTRDRVSFLMESGDRFFEIVDTGGIGIVDCDNLTKEIESQIEAAIDSADVVLFVVDVREGIVPLDEEVARRLRYIDKPIICVANKADHPSLDSQADEFYKLGRGKLVRVSTQQNRNKGELLDMLLERLPAEGAKQAPVESEMKIAICGRRNTGKSTFVNTLAQAERMIVSEVPGTTRDSVDVRFEMDGKTFTAIDTPGLKRNKSIRTDLDFYSFHRAQRSIRRADIVLMFFDCTQRMSKVDKQLVHYISEQYKPCVFVVNKWDLLYGQMPTDRWVEYLRDTFPTMWHAPIAFITGQTGKNVKALLNHSQNLYKQSLERIGTGELNRLLRAAVIKNPPPMYGMIRPKIYYATQVGTQPPTIVFMCNEPKAFQNDYRRYLLNVLRDNLSFGEVPIKLYLQRRRRADEKDELRMPGDDSKHKAPVPDDDSQLEDESDIFDETDFANDDEEAFEEE